MIKVENVSMRFRKGSDSIMSIKEFAIAKATKKISYSDFWVFKDISFSVNKGDVVGIIGRNGAGKSTLLKIISGILTPTEGKVTLGGKIVPMLELGSGFDFDLTGRENIFLNGSILGYSEEFLKERYDEIVEFSELGDFIESPIRNYSSGMMMRLAFSIATIVEPEILIVDEILAVGDEAFQKKSKRKMLELMGGGTTVLFVSHSLAQIREMCSKVVWIENGKIKMQGETKLVCDTYHKYINPDIEDTNKKHKASDAPKNLSDVLFVYGDDDNVYRKRVTYQREQLLVGMVASNEIYYKDINDDIAKLYRTFICVNCAKTDEMISFIRKAKSNNKVVYFDFSYCLESNTEDVQLELLESVSQYCDGIIASNESIENSFRKKGYKTFLNKITVEEKMHEYANWANYDRDVLPYLDTSSLNEDELINYNKACAVKQTRDKDGFRMGFVTCKLNSQQFINIKELIISRLKQNDKLLVNDSNQNIPNDMKVFEDNILFRSSYGRQDTMRMLSEADVIVIPVTDYEKEQDEIRHIMLLSGMVKVPCIVYLERDEQINLGHGLVCKNSNEFIKYIKDLKENSNIYKQIQQDSVEWSSKNDSFSTGNRFSKYIRNNMSENIVFLFNNNCVDKTTELACKHASIMKKKGLDTTIIVRGSNSNNIFFEGEELYVVSRDVTYSYQYFDSMVSFDWDSTSWMQNYRNVSSRSYVVQSNESDKMEKGSLDRFKAIQMCKPHTLMKYKCTSIEIQKWLKDEFEQDAMIIEASSDEYVYDIYTNYRL